MRIALLFHGRLPVAGYGGTGRVVHWLARGLAELGHEVTLLAAPGSEVPEARHIPVDPALAERADFDPRPFLPRGMEVLHAHRPLALADHPTLWTLHGTATRGNYPPHMVCLSADHAARSGAAHYVHNGLDPADFHFQRVKEPYDLFLGRLHSSKGWQWAVRGARRTGHRLMVAGGWKTLPLPGVRTLGVVDGPRRLPRPGAGRVHPSQDGGELPGIVPEGGGREVVSGARRSGPAHPEAPVASRIAPSRCM